MAVEDLQKSADKIENLLHEAQKKNDEVLSGKADKEVVERMAADFADLSAKHQEALTKIQAEEKARQDLELSIARVSENGGSSKSVLSNPEYKSAFNNYLKHRTSIQNELVDDEFRTMVKSFNPSISESDIVATKAMVVGSNPDGGFLVPVEQSTRIIERIYETSPMRTIATVENTASEAREYILDDGEFGSEMVGEVDTRNETGTSKIGIVTIPVVEQSAEPKATQKMLDDAVLNVEAWVNRKLSSKFARVENEQFINGDSNKEAKGILSYADWTTPTDFTAKTKGQYQRNALETIETVTASNFDGDDLINLQATLLSGYNGTWGMNRLTWSEILKLKDQNDQYLLNPAMLFSGSLGMQLLGDPVVMFNDLPTSTDGAIPVVYGDFREGYVVLDRIGIRVLRDPYTTKGYVKFYTTKRTGGGVVNFQAIKRLKIKAAV